ncbi:MAG: hypothetical protein E7379_02580 [Clostridiales bacterium]|nr:hypothetical protein [Clostridiales bacterium]
MINANIYHFIKPKLDGISARNSFWYEDYRQNKSECFVKAHQYVDGFAIVKKSAEDDDQYRDLLGRITNEKSESGNIFFKYICSQLEIEDIAPLHFADDIFYTGIKDALILKAKIQARVEFNEGKVLSKNQYQQDIENNFEAIETKRIVGLAMIKAKERAEKELAKKLKQDENKKIIKQQAFDETLDYLESL